MKEEYEAIVEAGFILQIDCPDLAMGRHTVFETLVITSLFCKLLSRLKY